MIVRSSVNACCTSRQKSSSSARSAGVRPSARGPRRRSCSRPSCFRDGMAAPAATSDSTKWRRVSIGSPSPSPERAAQQHSVGDQVDDYHQRSQHDLQRPRQSGRVQRREDVVLDEPAGVAFEAGAPAQGILERRERAHPALVLDHGPPDSAGEVQPREPTPAPGEEPAQHHEAHERRVRQHDRVGKEAGAHLSSLPYTAKSPAGPEPDGGCVSPFGGRRSGAHEVLRRVEEVLQRFLEAVRQLPQPAERVQLVRSEEHTSELQSLAYLVCRLLLEKKKNRTTHRPTYEYHGSGRGPRTRHTFALLKCKDYEPHKSDLSLITRIVLVTTLVLD